MKDLNSYVIDIIMEYKLDIQILSTDYYWVFQSKNLENIELLKAIGTVAGFKVKAIPSIHPKEQCYHIHVDKAN